MHIRAIISAGPSPTTGTECSARTPQRRVTASSAAEYTRFAASRSATSGVWNRWPAAPSRREGRLWPVGAGGPPAEGRRQRRRIHQPHQGRPQPELLASQEGGERTGGVSGGDVG